MHNYWKKKVLSTLITNALGLWTAKKCTILFFHVFNPHSDWEKVRTYKLKTNCWWTQQAITHHHQRTPTELSFGLREHMFIGTNTRHSQVSREHKSLWNDTERHNYLWCCKQLPRNICQELCIFYFFNHRVHFQHEKLSAWDTYRTFTWFISIGLNKVMLRTIIHTTVTSQ